jgi:hypothetical protein
MADQEQLAQQQQQPVMQKTKAVVVWPVVFRSNLCGQGWLVVWTDLVSTARKMDRVQTVSAHFGRPWSTSTSYP